MKGITQTLTLTLPGMALAFSPRPPMLADICSSTTALGALSFKFPEVSLFGIGQDEKRRRLKEKILALAADTKRGLTATDEQKAEMQELFADLEQLNPTRDPLKRPAVNGDWSLDYTTSDSILGKGGFERIGPIVQTIDTSTLSAKNSEVVRYGVIDVPRSVTAELSPVDGKFTDVKFKRFTFWDNIGFDAPEMKFRGSLDVTYLDDEVRLTRGDKGNIFVLTRMK